MSKDMEVRLTREQVLALAPDAASAKAAAGLATDGKWGLLGADAEVLWGECQGSGAKPYQTQVDLVALVSRCSCPSRKFPCKHGLAMLLLYADGNPRCVPGTRPAWVEEWMQGRRERAARKEEVAASKPPPDPQVQAAAAARREQARWARMQAGAAELQRWIADQFRQGLANLGAEFDQDARRMMARMVDAQAPGLAAQLQRAVGEGGRDLAQLADLGERLGLLQLLVQAVPRAGDFSAARQADLRAALGWPLERDTVLREGEAVHDRWHVQGQHLIEQPGNLLERRVWLQGLDSGRPALLQEYSHGGRGWEQHWRNGHVHAGCLHFHPGTVPLRAVPGELDPGVEAGAALPRTDTLDAAARAHALNPWLPQVPMRLQEAQIAHDGRSVRAQHSEGRLPLQLPAMQGWALLAFAGGHPVCLMGEWDGDTLWPLSAWNAQGERWERSAA
ncbi:SWIM zinc finger family protein [Xanthomonas sacchari]|uniref:SWIM zinc finger family protein n=1 Tax=Xanthomonas sacchari TaxID=56458 RepID=UPI00225DF67A|nr:SWIM zinc finger family protein [Xanthomonas sacchari]UYK82655.1 SWIM zinc finger family protein [Xanthomonas sacchari]